MSHSQSLQIGSVGTLIATVLSMNVAIFFMFCPSAFSAGYYRQPCEIQQQRSDEGSKALRICVQDAAKRTQGHETELFCHNENQENLQAMKELAECRYKNTWLK